MSLDELLERLCAPTKLERDRAETELCDRRDSLSASELSVAQAWICQRLEASGETWETTFGALTAARLLLSLRTPAGDSLLEHLHDRVTPCLEHAEFRVRLAAGECLGAMCAAGGLSAFRAHVPMVLAGIRATLERCEAIEAESEVEGALKRKLSSSEIFHDTAGWKSLETWMRCLHCMVESVGEREFQDYSEEEFFPLLFSALAHTNRFVRETGYQLLGASVSAARGRVQTLKVAEQLAMGLADNWSQVRMAASVATRHFLHCYGIIADAPSEVPEGLRLAMEASADERVTVLDLLLPPMCLNRHYVAEGVRLYSLETWRLAAGGRGPELVGAHLPAVVAFYLAQADADNHAVREAACACIAELAARVDPGLVRPHAARMMDALAVAFADDCWPVRDAACLACAGLAAALPAECHERAGPLLPRFLGNLADTVPSVRRGAAAALRTLLAAYPGEDGQELRRGVLDEMGPRLQAASEQKEEARPPATGVEAQSRFGVVPGGTGPVPTPAGPVDTRCENQVMYSCGSLAPKMKKGTAKKGGCHDGTFTRPTEPWEMADGCVHLLAELSSLPALHAALTPLVARVAEAARLRHYSQHVYLLESVFRCLPVMARGFGKRQFKAHLEPFLEPLAYGVEQENALAAAAAQACVRELAALVGRGILRGRIELHDPGLLPRLEPFL